MAIFDDLIVIPMDKRKRIIQCFDSLLTFRDSYGKMAPVISGYNWYTQLTEVNRVIAFSNVHETEAYRQDMLKDLERIGYDQAFILERIRKKAGAFLPEKGFRIRGDGDSLLPGLRIKDVRSGQYLNLDKFSEGQLDEFEGYLVSEDYGWELDIPFYNKGGLIQLANLFLRKSGIFIYDNNGIEVSETYKQKILRKPWSDAYTTPILVIGAAALEYSDELSGFGQAAKIYLIENGNEISFIIQKKLNLLKTQPQYELLKDLGFREEVCLANKPFLKYINEIT